MERTVILFGLIVLVAALTAAWAYQRARPRLLVIKILPEVPVVQQLLALLEAPGAPGALAAAVVYLEDLNDLFRLHDGPLPGSHQENHPERGRMWWRYTSGVWVLYHVADARRWHGRPVRTVTIVGFRAVRPVV